MLFYLSLPFSHIHTLTHTLTHSLTHSLTHTHTHTHTHTLPSATASKCALIHSLTNSQITTFSYSLEVCTKALRAASVSRLKHHHQQAPVGVEGSWLRATTEHCLIRIIIVVAVTNLHHSCRVTLVSGTTPKLEVLKGKSDTVTTWYYDYPAAVQVRGMGVGKFWGDEYSFDSFQSDIGVVLEVVTIGQKTCL